MAEQPASKKQRTHPQYELLYHPGIPGRGEFIRLAFEAAGVSYNDLGNQSEQGKKQVYATCDTDKTESDDGNPPIFAPPALRIPDAGPDGNALVISQTPNILFYLGEKLGLLPGDETKWHVQQVVLTALDLNNETHDTHHPIAVMQYYEDQKPEALKKAVDFREARLPKYFSYFNRVLVGNAERGNGQGKFFVGGSLTTADTTVWHVLDGLFYAFPKEMAARKKEFPKLLETFYEGVKISPGLKEYLASDRRKPYSMGIFRQYPELDRQG